jgi:AcrR family transcriptional regulator
MATNEERSANTRARLIATAAALFARDGYAATSTEAILEGAGVRRGALYHHFADKAALFEAVCEQLALQAVPAIEAATESARGPLDALVRGSIAWIAFVTHDHARRILLLDAPTVLGWARWQVLDERLAAQALRAAIAEAMATGDLHFEGSPELLATLANGALNALALRVGHAEPPLPARTWQRAVRAFWTALSTSGSAR